MSYTCPRCGATSRNPCDEKERYCGRCHRYEDDDECGGVAMQSRCPICLGEQYGPAVIAFSNGEIGCTVCGQPSVPMTVWEWQTALRIAQDKAAAGRLAKRPRP